MLYNLEWLKVGQPFPPSSESARIEHYKQNIALFNSGHFGDTQYIEVYDRASRRIARVIGNFEEVISFPVLFNYQRLITLKMADLVCGEHPVITGSTPEENASIKETRDRIDFDKKLFKSVIDMSRFGDAVLRIYKDTLTTRNFTTWSLCDWMPVVSMDGTDTVLYHVLCWTENKSKDPYKPDWYLHAQIHGTQEAEIGYYDYKVFKLDSSGGAIKALVSQERVNTGLDICAVMQLNAYTVTGSIFGYDDYEIIDSILAEIIARVGQISNILDKHADPSMTGPPSMLTPDPETGEMVFKRGKFYLTNDKEEGTPAYLVWEAQLEPAFKQVELLVNHLYILSEMGSAILGAKDGSATAISGAGMRYKMVNPLAKARRIANSLTLPLRNLLSAVAGNVEAKNLSVFWADGLPDDPRENMELVKLATGKESIQPLEKAIVEYLGRSAEEAKEWVEMLDAEEKKQQDALAKANAVSGVDSRSKGSTTGVQSFKRPNTTK